MTKGFSVAVSAAAESDLFDIWFAIAAVDARAADRMLEALDLAVKALSENPDRGAPRPELGRGVRMLIEKPYLVFYRRDENSVRVQRVLHGARDILAAF